MMIGANDNQPIITYHNIVNTAQPEWINTYKKRITEILYNSEIPWIWVCQPPFKNSNLTQKMRTFNELYQNATKVAKGYFVDILDDFLY